MIFFAIGNSFIKSGLDLNYVTPVGAQGSNFAEDGQTLQQSFSVAANIFSLVDRGAINFALIGLSPDALFLGEAGNFTTAALSKNIQTLNALIKLCLDNDTKPVGLILPVAPATREYWQKIFLNPLFDILGKFGLSANFKIVNLLNLNLDTNFFTDETHLTREGAMITSTLLTAELNRLGIFSKADFAKMSYEYFDALAKLTDKKSLHTAMNEIFADTLAELRNKDRVRVGFVTDHAATWCGNDIYNLFAMNPRFETTVFLCRSSESTPQDFRHDFEQFKNAGLNAVGILDKNLETPSQDVIFFLRPYFNEFSKSFRLNELTPRTLMIYIPYSLDTIPSYMPNYYNLPLFHLGWKYFFESEL